MQACAKGTEPFPLPIVRDQIDGNAVRKAESRLLGYAARGSLTGREYSLFIDKLHRIGEPPIHSEDFSEACLLDYGDLRTFADNPNVRIVHDHISYEENDTIGTEGFPSRSDSNKMAASFFSVITDQRETVLAHPREDKKRNSHRLHLQGAT